MKENTFTFTARSSDDPDKTATFTLNNGTVSVELGNALVEQVSKAVESFGDEELTGRISSWVKPAAIGTLQQTIKPIPLSDFDAEMNEDALQMTAWIRTRGLRLAPIMMTWQDVDNPQGAEAFVAEVQDRKEAIADNKAVPDPMDYWASWLVIGLIILALPVLVIKLLRQKQTS